MEIDQTTELKNVQNHEGEYNYAVQKQEPVEPEMILDKHGRPMTDEQIEERIDYLTCLFRLDFRVPDVDQFGNYYQNGKLVDTKKEEEIFDYAADFSGDEDQDEDEKYDQVDYCSSVDDELLESYRKDFFAMGRRGEIRFFQECLDYYKPALRAAKVRLNIYAATNVIAEEDKNKMKKKFVKNNEKRTVNHIALNHAAHKEMRARITMCRKKLIEYGVLQPKKKSQLNIKIQKKMDSIDKVLYSYEPPITGVGAEPDPTK